MQLTIGVIGKAHGLRGEVTVAVRTDTPEERFRSGVSVETEPQERGPLTITRSRWHSGRMLVLFEGVDDRTAAEALRGTRLTIQTDDLVPLSDPDDFYDHQLVGLSAVTPEEVRLGTTKDVMHTPAGDMLVVETAEGREILIPFVRDIVPTVDIAGGRVVIVAPEGLLEL